MGTLDGALSVAATPRQASVFPAVDLWSIRAAGRTWTGQIRCIGEVHGGAWEFVLRRDNDLAYSRRFVTHSAAIHEAVEQRQLVERTWTRSEVLVDLQA